MKFLVTTEVSLGEIADIIGYRPDIEVSVSSDWDEIQGWKIVEKRTPHHHDVVRKEFSIRRKTERGTEFFTSEVEYVASVVKGRSHA